LLRVHGIAAEKEQIQHRLGTPKIGVIEMLRCAKQFGLKARLTKTKWNRLAKTPLAAIAVLQDGSFTVLVRAGEEKAIVHNPASRPQVMTRPELEEIWDGQLLLMTRRGSLSDVSRRFNLTWFLGAVHKYRRILSEVLFASFFLHIFALVSPLFFQVVIDKVLVHQSVSTLEVLVIGLVTVSVFEAILGTLRTYVFAHTANRIDVELGARLFHHLLALCRHNRTAS
jgi:subfamily B ATP-binding cassette protein HlyB/CyaB